MTARKKTSKTAKKATAKAKKKPTGKSAKKVAKKKASKKRSASKARKPKANRAKKAAKPKTPKRLKKAPAALGELVRTRLTTISKRLLAPVTTSAGQSSSKGVSYRNPAQAAMLKRLLRS